MARRSILYRDLFDHERTTINPALRMEGDVCSRCIRTVKRLGKPKHNWHSPIVTEWAVIGPTDARGYRMSIQWVRGDRRGVMVRIGCRFKTMDQAWHHWRKRKLRGEASANIVWALIELVIAHAKAQNLPGTAKLKFAPKPKRK